MLNNKIKLLKLFFYFVLIFLLANLTFAAISNTDYKSDIILSSGGTENSSSSNYKTQALVSTVASSAISNNDYINYFGFYSSSPTTTTTTLPASSGTPAEPSQGGPSGGPRLIKDFVLSDDFLKIVLTQGETIRKTIKVRSTGNSPADVLVDVSNLEHFIFLDKPIIPLGVGQEKEVQLIFTASSTDKPGIYTGIVYFKELTPLSKEFKIVPLIIVIEVKEKSALFDIKLESEKTEFFKGENIEAIANLFNFGYEYPIDVTIYYAFREIGGENILSETKSLAVEKTARVPLSLPIPEYIKSGKYLFYAEIQYQNSTAYSSLFIEVKEKTVELTKFPKTKIILFSIIFLLVLSLIIFIIKYKNKLRNFNVHKNKKSIKK